MATVKSLTVQAIHQVYKEAQSVGFSEDPLPQRHHAYIYTVYTVYIFEQVKYKILHVIPVSVCALNIKQ